MTEIDDKPRKVIIIGEGGCGKTCMIIRLIDNNFVEDGIVTIGVSFKKKTFIVSNNKQVDINFWDTCGQEEFKSVVKTYMRGSDCVIVAFDVSNRNTFDEMNYWIRQAREILTENVPIVIAASKIDLPRMIDWEDVESFCESLDCTFFKVSSKTGEGINELFQYVAELAYQHGVSMETNGNNVNIVNDNNENQKKCC